MFSSLQVFRHDGACVQHRHHPDRYQITRTRGKAGKATERAGSGGLKMGAWCEGPGVL